MNQNRVQHCIEILCQKGCTDVLECICALEQNRPVEETHDLSREETLVVLSELKSIMAVYQGPNT